SPIIPALPPILFFHRLGLSAKINPMKNFVRFHFCRSALRALFLFTLVFHLLPGSLAQEAYLLKSREQSRLEYYQEAGLSAEVLVEDILLELPDGTERMLSAGSWILTKKAE